MEEEEEKKQNRKTLSFKSWGSVALEQSKATSVHMPHYLQFCDQ